MTGPHNVVPFDRPHTEKPCTVRTLIDMEPLDTDHLATARRLIETGHERRDFLALALAIGLVIKVIEEGGGS